MALVLGSAFVGLASGVGSAQVITNFEAGVGGTLKEVGLLIALGATVGNCLADSGGADRVIDTLLSKAQRGAVPWAMALAAVIIGYSVGLRGAGMAARINAGIGPVVRGDGDGGVGRGFGSVMLLSASV